MKIILASKSGVRKTILDKYKIENEVIVSNVDEDQIKESLLGEGVKPLEISKNLAEIKSIQVKIYFNIDIRYLQQHNRNFDQIL